MVTSTVSFGEGYILKYNTPKALPTKTVIHCCLQYLFKRGCHPTQIQLMGEELIIRGSTTYIVKVRTQ